MRRMKRKTVRYMETGPADYASDHAIAYSLYRHLDRGAEVKSEGSESESILLQSLMDEIPRFDRLLAKPQEYWNNLLNHYYISRPHSCVIARPSIDYGNLQRAAEEKRIQDQIDALLKTDENSLNLAKQRLDRAVARNERPVPPEVITSNPTPDVKNISTIPVYNWYNRLPSHLSLEELRSHNNLLPADKIVQIETILNKPINASNPDSPSSPGGGVEKEWPCSVHLSHIPSQFGSFIVLLDTHSLTSTYVITLNNPE